MRSPITHLSNAEALRAVAAAALAAATAAVTTAEAAQETAEDAAFAAAAAQETADAALPYYSDTSLIGMLLGENYYTVPTSIDSNGIVAGAVKWADGSTGTYTRTSVDSASGTWASFTITHSGANKIITQAAVTRDADGYFTSRPIPTVASL